MLLNICGRNNREKERKKKVSWLKRVEAATGSRKKKKKGEGRVEDVLIKAQREDAWKTEQLLFLLVWK